MVTVADTSPLNYLVLIEAVEVLRQLYERICVPEAVIEELRSADAPVLVQKWAASLPAWVDVHAVADESLNDPRWQALHRGERAALALATRLKADLILMDERMGVAAGRKNGFRMTGTLATFRRKNSFSALRRRGRSVTGSFAAMTSGEKKRPPWGTFLLGR